MEVQDYSELPYPSSLIPAIPPGDLPLDRKMYEYSPTFSADFNKNSINAINNSKQTLRSKEVLQDVFSLGPYLFFADSIHPKALTEFFFSKYNQNQHAALLYFFFSSVSLEFVSIVDAMRMLLPRVALPDNAEQLRTIIGAFAAAYYDANEYFAESKEEVANITVEAVLLALYNEYSIFSGEDALRSIRPSIGGELSVKRMPLCFAFADEGRGRELKVSGSLARLGQGLLKRKKKNYYHLQSNSLQFYKSRDSREVLGVIPLDGVEVEQVPAQGREQAHFVIRSVNEKPFGYRVNMGKRKYSKKTQYTMFADSENEISEWVRTLKLTAFYHTVESLATRQKQ